MARVPDQHSLLPLPDHFVIAGDRFREEYYWDSYWIVQGLIICGLVDTAQVLLLKALCLSWPVLVCSVPPHTHSTTFMSTGRVARWTSCTIRGPPAKVSGKWKAT